MRPWLRVKYFHCLKRETRVRRVENEAQLPWEYRYRTRCVRQAHQRNTHPRKTCLGGRVCVYHIDQSRAIHMKKKLPKDETPPPDSPLQTLYNSPRKKRDSEPHHSTRIWKLQPLISSTPRIVYLIKLPHFKHTLSDRWEVLGGFIVLPEDVIFLPSPEVLRLYEQR